jgi:hypothetical protein
MTEAGLAQPEPTPPDGTPAMAAAWPPFQFDRIREYRAGGVHVVSGRLSRNAGERQHGAPRLWVTALSEQDLHAGRGGFGGTEAQALVSLFEWLRPERPVRQD